jgi:hypothetical protein
MSSASQPSSVIKGHRFHPFQQSRAVSQPVSRTLESGESSAIPSSNVSELQSSPLLDYLGFRFHVRHCVMICVACGFAFLPGHALGHVKNKHEIPVSKDQLELWNTTVLEWNVTTSPLIPLPPNRQPVELLKVHPGAYCCNVCKYAALTPATFSKHWSNSHRSDNRSLEERYHTGHVQTFYSHAPCTYFEVDLPIPDSTPLFDIYMKKEVPSYAPFEVTIPSAPREIPPLLYATRWHEHLAEYITDKRKRRSLMTLAHPTMFTKCPLWKLVWNYLGVVADLARASTMRVRCLLAEYPR